jgi:hypothetical protein
VRTTRFREQIELEQSDTDSSSAALRALPELVEIALPPWEPLGSYRCQCAPPLAMAAAHALSREKLGAGIFLLY